MKWKLINVPVKDLKEFPGNPRKLTKKGMQDLENSIKKFGVAEPIVINADMTIIGGHGRKKTLEKLNVKEVDCYIPDRALTEQEYKELNIRLNKNIAGEFDFDILANEFEIDELLQWGFEEFELGLGYPGEEGIMKEEELKGYNKTHLLISFYPKDLNYFQELIKSIENIEGVEIEQSSN